MECGLRSTGYEKAPVLRRLIDHYVGTKQNLAMSQLLMEDKLRTAQNRQAEKTARLALSAYIDNLADALDTATKILHSG